MIIPGGLGWSSPGWWRCTCWWRSWSWWWWKTRRRWWRRRGSHSFRWANPCTLDHSRGAEKVWSLDRGLFKSYQTWMGSVWGWELMPTVLATFKLSYWPYLGHWYMDDQKYFVKYLCKHILAPGTWGGPARRSIQRRWPAWNFHSPRDCSFSNQHHHHSATMEKKSTKVMGWNVTQLDISRHPDLKRTCIDRPKVSKLTKSSSAPWCLTWPKMVIPMMA